MRDAAERLGDEPLVVALAIDAVDVVDVAALTERLPGGRFVGVVAAQDADELLAVLAVLRGHVDEVVASASGVDAVRQALSSGCS